MFTTKNEKDYFLFDAGGIGDFIIHSYKLSYKKRFNQAISEGHRIHIFYDSESPFFTEWLEDIPNIIFHKIESNITSIGQLEVDRTIMRNNPYLDPFPWYHYQAGPSIEETSGNYNTVLHLFAASEDKSSVLPEIVELFDKPGNLFLGRNGAGRMKEILPTLKYADNAIDQLNVRESASYVRGAKRFVGSHSCMLNVAWWNSIPSICLCSDVFAKTVVIGEPIESPYSINHSDLPEAFRKYLIIRENNSPVPIDKLISYFKAWGFI
jgi:hypothetical protein